MSNTAHRLAAIGAALVLCVCLVCWPGGGAALAAEGESAPAVAEAKVYDPPNTKVAVLPFVNETGVVQEEQTTVCENATTQLRDAFADRGFQALDLKAVAGAPGKLGLNITDSEDRKKENFQKIADALGADLLVCGVLMVYKRYDPGRAIARIELKVWDARDRLYRVRGVQAGEGRTRSILASGRSRGIREQAMRNTIDKALKDFLKPYPVVKAKTEAPQPGSANP